jgi:hypothetical protein
VLVAAASNAAVDNVALALLAADPKLEVARAGVPGGLQSIQYRELKNMGAGDADMMTCNGS